MSENEQIFEFEGKKYKLDYGFSYIGEGAKQYGWDYGSYIALQYPEKKWIYEQGGSCQGEWVALGYDNTGFYFHQGSYGSCSGCDWLEGLSDKEDAIEFLKKMREIIKIGTTWEEAKKYLEQTKANGWDDLKEAIDEVIKKYEGADPKDFKHHD